MKDATLRQLRVFECVARHLSFSRAAEELHLSQPAVSMQVRLLQEHAGVALFEHLGKRVHLTAAGHEMLHHAAKMLAHLREAGAAMSLFHDDMAGTLNVAAISTAGYFIPQLLAEFARRYPKAKLNLQILNGEQLLHSLHDNRCDVAVMTRPSTQAEFIHTAFAPHPYFVVACGTHPLAKQKNIALAQLQDQAFVVREAGSDTFSAMKEWLIDALPNCHIAMRIASPEAVKQAVMAGLGIAFVSAHTVRLELQSQHLVALDIVGYPVMQDWLVVRHKDKRLPRVAQAFHDFLLSDGATLLHQLTVAA